MYFIRLWILSTTYKLQTYFFSVASKYLGSKLYDSIEKVNSGLEAFEKCEFINFIFILTLTFTIQKDIFRNIKLVCKND